MSDLRHPIVQNTTHMAPPMPDKIYGMGKTNGKTGLIHKKETLTLL
jgi:hypothetical protein